MARISRTSATGKDISTIQDLSIGVYDIESGSGRKSHLVAFDTTSSDKVVLACADIPYSDATSVGDLTTVPAIGVVIRDYGTRVRIRRQGHVTIKKETGTTINSGDIVFLSYNQIGTVTNVPPTTGVLQQIGIAENNAAGNTHVRVTFAYSHIVLLN